MQITTNITSQQNGQIQDQVNQNGQAQKPETGKELSLANAVKGTVFQGDILDIRGNQVSIQVGKYILNALLEQGMSVNIGDSLSFMVKENTGAKVLLKPFSEGGQSMTNTLIKTLEEASLPVTERNLVAVKEMMSHGMPVDKGSMAEIGKLLHQFGQVRVDTLISLKSHNLPVTEANIVQYESYMKHQGMLTDGVGEMIRELTGMAESGKTPGALAKLSGLVEKLNELFAGSGKAAELPGGQSSQTVQTGQIHPDQTAAGQVQKQEMGLENGAVSKELSDTAGKRTLQETVQESKAETTGKEAFRLKAGAEGVSSDLLAEIRHLVKEDIKTLETNIKSRFFITPAQLAAQGEQALKESYETLAKTTDKMMEILQSAGEGQSKLMNTAGDLKNNMNFMSDFNEMAAYVQLPVKLSQKEQTGELYVLSRKRNRQEKDGPKTAFLHLDMDNLGSTDVRVSMTGTKVSTKFSLEDDQSVRLVEEHLPELKKRLEELGYSVELSVEETEEKKIPFERILEADRPSKEIKRFAFDVRA